MGRSDIFSASLAPLGRFGASFWSPNHVLGHHVGKMMKQIVSKTIPEQILNFEIKHVFRIIRVTKQQLSGFFKIKLMMTKGFSKRPKVNVQTFQNHFFEIWVRFLGATM